MIAAGLVVWLAMSSGGFTDDAIASVRQSIKDEWSKKDGVESVVNVELIRVEKRKLTGFVVLLFKGVASPIQKDCTATMADDDKNFIWQCR